MTEAASPKAMFACFTSHLEGGHGGVQLCTREYLQTIEAAGLECEVAKLDPDLSLGVRIKRRIFASPYAIRPKAWQVEALLAQVRAFEPDLVFLNQVSLASLAAPIRQASRKPLQIVLLSHGLESTDLLHLSRLRGELPLSGSLSPSPGWVIGDTIVTEARLRKHVDVVIALSPFDVVLEGWMGARRAEWMPRTIADASLDWSPVAGRFGYLGTLDHAPNLEGLVRVLERLTASDKIEVRIVGGPASLGEYLDRRFPHARYLGPLDDMTLRAEAGSWQAFLHPIFCDARGCSTKLATALGWRLPIVTTSRGRRGYAWTEGDLKVCDDAGEFAALCGRMDLAEASVLREQVFRVAQSSPTLADNAARLRRQLALPPLALAQGPA